MGWEACKAGCNRDMELLPLHLKTCRTHCTLRTTIYNSWEKGARTHLQQLSSCFRIQAPRALL